MVIEKEQNNENNKIDNYYSLVYTINDGNTKLVSSDRLLAVYSKYTGVSRNLNSELSYI